MPANITTVDVLIVLSLFLLIVVGNLPVRLLSRRKCPRCSVWMKNDRCNRGWGFDEKREDLIEGLLMWYSCPRCSGHYMLHSRINRLDFIPESGGSELSEEVSKD